MRLAAPPEIFGLLSDPVRWRLVDELGRSDQRVGELVELVGKPQNLVSYHLGELRRSGVVSSRRSSADGRDVYYRVDLFRCRELLDEAGLALHPGLNHSTRSDPTRRPPRGRARMLFLCTGNSARSQIAEALAEHLSAGAVQARSAGTTPTPLHPFAIQVMAERGIDIAGRHSTPISRFTRSRFDRVITLCDKVRETCPDFPGDPMPTHWSIPNPTATEGDDATRYAAFEHVADDIERRVTLLLADLEQ